MALQHSCGRQSSVPRLTWVAASRTCWWWWWWRARKLGAHSCEMQVMSCASLVLAVVLVLVILATLLSSAQGRLPAGRRVASRSTLTCRVAVSISRSAQSGWRDDKPICPSTTQLQASEASRVLQAARRSDRACGCAKRYHSSYLHT